MQGWIKLHRRIIDHWIWQDPEYLRMWIYLLMDVNHEDRKILWNKDVIIVKRGQKITSQKKLSKELKCTRGTTRHFLSLLEKDSMIELNCNQHYTQITICNYDQYQLLQPTDNQQTTNRQPTDNQQTDTNKNYKNIKNDKNKKNSMDSQKASSKKDKNNPPKKVNDKPNPNNLITPIMFNQFWELYPRKEKKGYAFTCWEKLCKKSSPIRPTWREVKKALLNQKKSKQWQDKKYIPHPSTWINQNRWLDDVDTLVPPKPDKKEKILRDGVWWFLDTDGNYYNAQGKKLQ